MIVAKVLKEVLQYLSMCVRTYLFVSLSVCLSAYNGILVPVRTSFGLRRRTMYQRNVDVDMLNAVKSLF